MFKNRNIRSAIESCMWEHLVNLMVTEAFLAAICKQVGVSDAVTGVVSSIIAVSCAAQMFTGLVVKPGCSVKKRMMLFGPLNVFLFATLYIIPFLPFGSTVRVPLFVAMIVGAYIVLNVIFPVKYKWRLSFVEPGQRGRFSAANEMTSLMCGMVFTLSMSAVVDYFKGIGKESVGFILCGVAIFAAAVMYWFALRRIDDMPPYETEAGDDWKQRLKSSFALLAKNKNLRKLLGMDLIYQTAYYISIPFWGTYLIGETELGFTLTAVSLFGILYNVARMALSPFIGRYADRKGYCKCLTLCLFLIMGSFLVRIFIVPGTRLLYAPAYALFAMSQAGIYSGLINITYDYVGEKDFADAQGARNALGGIVGFLVSLVGGVIVKAVQDRGNTLFGQTVYAQQVLSVISAVLIAGLIVYILLVIRPLKKLDSQTDDLQK